MKQLKMNTVLRFTWGHIISFVAVIAIMYASFVGYVYGDGGDFLWAKLVSLADKVYDGGPSFRVFVHAGVGTVVIMLALLLCFLGVQLLKATGRRFTRRIWIERILMAFSPVVLILCMLPAYHFVAVVTRSGDMSKEFSESISQAKGMFADYKSYVNERESNYRNMLDEVIERGDKHELKECGFEEGKLNIQKENMTKILHLLLLPPEIQELETNADSWIDDHSESVSAFNVFVFGNTEEIKNAVTKWSYQLQEQSSKRLNNEELYGNTVSDFPERSLSNVTDGLDNVRKCFTEKGSTPASVLLSLLLTAFFYACLLLPYYLQDRHSKSRVSLLPAGNKNYGIDDPLGGSSHSDSDKRKEGNKNIYKPF